MTVTITAQMGLEARDNLLWIVARRITRTASQEGDRA